MRFDLMVPGRTWAETAELARTIEANGFSGMLFTEQTQTPWMSIAAAAEAAPSLEFSTGIAVAFARQPIVSAGLAWELAENTGGRFRLGLGSQVKAHVERRYGTDFDPPGPRMRDYVQAVKACFRAFRGEEPLLYEGPYYRMSLLPAMWMPRRHAYGDVKVDISAVGPWMCRMAGEVADGIHVHPFHSVQYLENRLKPAVAEGAAKAGRPLSDVELTIPVFAVPGDTPEARSSLLEMTRARIGFYGSTRNYSFQFDDLGFEGTSARLNDRLKAGDLAGLASTISDEMLEQFAVVARWDEMADALIDRYRGTATRLVMYLGEDSLAEDPANAGRWAEIARAVTAAG
ncbi:MAG TPA: TIGR03617 family F420-dependent LLM class oxidoreductase [Acidimicrobiales bacterium]|jgi:probable F420-dependent oxidoreductase|nr:TIGR03617 family F420-dependent LLM class oxidoreductase [Acidimicrobiales bacterium]